MTLTMLAQGEPWMTPHERDLNGELIRAIADFLTEAGVPHTALVALRVNDVATTWLLARRLESALAPEEGEPPPCPTPAQADAIGKCRERLRRAIKELEQGCAKTDTPVRQGFVDQMYETIQKVRATGLVADTPFGDELLIDSHDSEHAVPETTGQAAPEEEAQSGHPRTTPSTHCQPSTAEGDAAGLINGQPSHDTG